MPSPGGSVEQAAVITRAAFNEKTNQAIDKKASAPKKHVEMADKIAGAVQQNLQQNPDQSPVLTMAEQLANLDGKSQDATEAIKANTGADFDTKGNKIDPKAGTLEAERRDRARNADTATLDILSGKVTKEEDWYKSEYDKVRQGLDQFIDLTGVPGLTEVAYTDRGEIYTALLDDPDVRKALIEINGKANEFRVANIDPAIIERAKETAEHFAIKDKERSDVDAELAKIEERIADPEQKAKDARDLARLQKANLEAQKRSLQRKIDSALELRSNINRGRREGDADIENEALDRFDSQMEAIDKQIAQRDEIANLPKRAEQLRTDKSRLDQEAQEAKDANDLESNELSLAQGNRRDAEEAWVRSKENAVRDAVVKVFDERRALAEAASQKLIAEAAKNGKDEAERAMGKLWLNRHFKVDSKGEVVLDKKGNPTLVDGQYEKDTKQMIKAGEAGGEVVLREMLTKHFTDQLKGQYPDNAALKQAVENAVNAKMADREFVNPWRERIEKETFKGFFRTEGKSFQKKDTIAYLEQFDWGKNALEAAFESPEVSKLEEEAREKGMLKENEGLKEWIKKNPKKAAAMGLFALIASVAAGMVSAPVGFAGITGTLAASGGAAAYSRR